MEIKNTICGFRPLSTQELPELEGRLHEMEHIKSGARLVWLDRDDENKTFGIGFRTPPENHTGVFHILEHSVLCGSQRYPVKEPFVELMKSSMNTFLNAITFPDKTVYPISSRNDQDFVNLMRVYLDAVLHPRIYASQDIFHQEGWHYEIDENGKPSYKGVVFNEMKGALSTQERLLRNAIGHNLFPDTCYGYVSGGDPAYIPDLTYEYYIGCHRRFYHPSNSYIFLDGRMDIEKVLGIMDAEYLSEFDKQPTDSEIAVQAPVQSENQNVYYEVSADASLKNRATMAWGFVLGDYSCREKQMAAQILSDALCGSNQAPLKAKLLSAGLAQDVRLSLVDRIMQPYMILEVCNCDENRADEIKEIVFDEIRRLAEEGLDHEQLSAALANMEFQMRERDFGRMPRGLNFAFMMLGQWLYGGNPAADLQVGELFTSLNAKLAEGYFEKVLEEIFLSNNHNCQVTMLPSPTLGAEKIAKESARLQAESANWTEADIAELKEIQAKLTAWQQSKDTPEDLAKLPHLQLSDIEAEPQEIPTTENTLAGCTLLQHDIATSGIDYVNLYFDISDLSQEQLSAVSFLCSVLGSLDTANHSSEELQKLRRLNCGSLSFNLQAHEANNDPSVCHNYLSVSYSALNSKLENATALVREILCTSKLNDSRKLQEILNQDHSKMERAIVNMGNAFARGRIAANTSVSGVVEECVGGFTYIQWLKALKNDFENQSSALIESLSALSAQIFVKERLTLSLTGQNNAAASALESQLLNQLPSGQKAQPCALKPWGKKKEGIIIPAGVSFAGLGGSLLDFGGKYNGHTRVMARATFLAYLWNVIRVQGGAYGTGLTVSECGNACFHSYRDPSADRSLTYYRKAADFLDQFCASNPDLTGLIVGAVAESDPLMLPQAMGKAGDAFWMKGISHADRCQLRQEILSTTPADIAALIPALRQLGEEGSVCVIGGKEKVEACAAELDVIHTL